MNNEAKLFMVGVFTTEIKVSDDASPQEKLFALAGRQPNNVDA